MPSGSTTSGNVQPIMRALAIPAIALGLLIVPEIIVGALVALTVYRLLSNINQRESDHAYTSQA